MPHSPYIRQVPGSRDTVLLIHGIVGSPRHFDFLLDAIPENYNICNLLLPGHGGSVEDFSASSMAAWKAHVDRHLVQFAREGHRVTVVGHSMGTLFAIQAAVAQPQLIRGLFLLSVPLYPMVSPTAAAGSLALALGLDGKTAGLIGGDGSVTLTPRLWKYLPWLPRFAELLQECRRTRALLSRLTVPCRAYHARNDQMVSPRSAKLLAAVPCVRLIQLPHSCHFTYPNGDADLLRRHLREMLTREG